MTQTALIARLRKVEEALVIAHMISEPFSQDETTFYEALADLRELIKEAEEQEPVGWYAPDSGLPFGWTEEAPTEGAIYLYTALGEQK